MINSKTAKNIGRISALIKIVQVIFTNQAKFRNGSFKTQVPVYKLRITTKPVCATYHGIGIATPEHNFISQFIIDGYANRPVGYFFGKDPVYEITIVCSQSAKHTNMQPLSE
jgi:hypothetical protein